MNIFSGNFPKMQCCGQNACGGCGYVNNCGDCCGSCPGCAESCRVVYKTVTRIVNPAPPPAPVALTGEYAYIYNESAQTVAAASPIAFASNGTLTSGITHPAGGAALTFDSPGTYAVWFSVVGAASNQFSLFVNDSVAPGIIYGTETGTAAARPTTTGFGIVTVTAADSTVSLINNTGAPVTLATGIGGSASNINASLMAIRLPDPA